MYLEDCWRLLDPTWGAGRDYSVVEHFFLTDPHLLSYSHYPCHETESGYERWQLLEDPITLTQFNTMAHLAPAFFQFSLELVDKIPTPWVVQDSAVLRIKAADVILYKVPIFIRFRFCDNLT